MTWTIEYTKTAATQLRKLDRQAARRILDYLDGKIAPLENPRTRGKALSDPSESYGDIGLEIIKCSVKDKIIQCGFWSSRQTIAGRSISSSLHAVFVMKSSDND